MMPAADRSMMSPERWERVVAVYEGAREREASARDAFLTRQCYGDSALRREVESLLAQEGARGVIDQAMPSLAAAALPPEGALPANTQLGPYRIERLLGAGGMGHVYRATDTRLNRTVALKVLPQTLNADPQFRARFEREAQAIAKVSHPHICTLHDVGHQDGTDYLVLEFLEGETLAARLERGPLAFDQALTCAIQIADALDAAHRQDIVHRDLKPGNVMLTKSGAKLLDFGLACLRGDAASARQAASLSMLPTTPPGLTVQGTILGTFQYMAPEQLEGHEADTRTDLFAFGAVVYEMFTGKKAFEGKSQASLIGAIMHAEPPPISSLQPLTPPLLDRVVRQALAKDPDDRWQSARDLRRELEWVASARPGDQSIQEGAARPQKAKWLWISSVALLLAAVAALGARVIVISRPRDDAPSIRFSVPPPDGTEGFGNSPNTPAPPMALSPDGRWLAFGVLSGDTQQIWVRPLDALEARPLPGTDGVRYLFWSPDSRSVAFLTLSELKRVDVSGGTARKIADVAYGGCGGTWNRDDTILVSAGPVGEATGLFRVNARDGNPVSISSSASGGMIRRCPFFLPDGRQFVYLGRGPRSEDDAIYLGSLDSVEHTRLFAANGKVQYASGQLLYVSGQTLMAQPFDLSSRQVIDPPVPIMDTLTSSVQTGYSGFSVSENGVLVAATISGIAPKPLARVDRSGRLLGRVGSPGIIGDIEAAGGRVVYQRQPAALWLLDVGRNVDSRLIGTSAGGPAISPNGDSIVFQDPGSRTPGMLRLEIASPGKIERLVDGFTSPNDWSRDGRWILFMRVGSATTQFDLAALDLSAGNRTVTPFLQTPANEGQARFSPDSRWVAYQSDETGRNEIYICHFPDAGQKTPVSNAGGRQPRWSSRGNELFYVSADGFLTAVSVHLEADRVALGASQRLFRIQDVRVGALNGNGVNSFFGGLYAPLDNGEFLARELDGTSPRLQLDVLTNWPATLKAPGR